MTTQHSTATSGELALSLATAVGELLFQLSKVIFLTLLAVGRLVILTGPHLLTVGRKVVKFHQTQMTRTDVIVEVLFILIIVWFLMFRKSISAACKKIEKSVALKSKVALRWAPHVALFSLALVFAVIGRKFLAPLTTPRRLPLFTLVLPLIVTLFRNSASGGLVPTMRALEGGASTAAPDVPIGLLKGVATSGRQLVLLWVVLAAYHSVATVLSILPLSQRMQQYLPVVREFTLVLFIWAVLSPVLAELIFEATSPFISFCAERIPSTSVFHKRAAGTQTTVSNLLLAIMGSLGPRRQAVVSAIMQESTSFVIILFCLPLPTPLATLGAVAIALLIPALRSLASIQAWEKSDGGVAHRGKETQGSPGSQQALMSMSLGVFLSGRKASKSVAVATEIIEQQQRCIEYWVCLGALWALRTFGFVLWPSITMLLTWYLQHSFLRGSATVCARVLPVAEFVYARFFKLAHDGEGEGEGEKNHDGDDDQPSSNVSTRADAGGGSSTLAPEATNGSSSTPSR